MGVHQQANFPANLELRETQTEDVARFGIAAKTWEGSSALLDCLLPTGLAQRDYQPATPLDHQPTPPTQTQLIDLGSGTCHLAIALATAYTQLNITVTDLPQVLPLLRRNIHATPNISPRALSWGDTHQATLLLNSLQQYSPQLIITCSDLIFFPFLFIPLLRTLLILTTPLPSSQSPPLVIFSYKQRSAIKEFPFFSLLGRYFLLEPILSRSGPSEQWELTYNSLSNQDDDDNKIYLIRATRIPSTTTDPYLNHIIFNTNNTNHQQDPLLSLGNQSTSDQWEFILLSNLSDQSIFS